jgi:hypothetical protein
MTREEFVQFLAVLLDRAGEEHAALDVADVNTRTDGLDVMLVDGTTFEVDIRRNGQFVP